MYYNNVKDINQDYLPIGIKKIDLALNNLRDITFLSRQKDIEYLQLQSNEIENIVSISHLTKLTQLSLMGNSISDISPLAKLTNLTSLNLSGNNVIDCVHLQDMELLVNLNLSDSKVLNFENILNEHSLIKFLYLNNCRLEDVPSINQLRDLKILDLSDNLIKSVEFLGQLDNLFHLDLSNNEILEFKLSSELPKLYHLNLDKNKLVNLPDVDKCPNLEYLIISRNLFNDPSEALKGSRINTLNISSNQIKDFSWIEDLHFLTDLDISRNPVTDLSFLLKRPTLTQLALDGLESIDIPVLTKMKQLKHLSMDNCQLKSYRFIGALPKLEYLSLRYSRVSNIKFISRLKSIKHLDLKSNDIRDCTPIVNLVNLEYLNLVDNSIAKIPAKFISNILLDFDFSDGESYIKGNVFFKGNPIEFPSIEILSQGREFAIKFLENADRLPLNECKVILIGRGGVGKTTLQKALMNEPIDLREGETHGIRKIAWRDYISAFDKGFINVNFWDFGGQHIQQALHQFFYSKNTVYILVLDRRKEDDPEEFLELVRGYGGNSPVIVVFNNKSENSAEYELTPSLDSTLLNKYPNIVKPIFGVNCIQPNDRGIQLLRAFLGSYIPHLDHVRASYPSDWLTIKIELLERVGTNYLLYADYRKICLDHNLSEDRIQKGLAEMLATVGTITFFDRPFGDNYYVLNPDWLTTGAYQIILSYITRLNKGRIGIEDLKRVLADEDSLFSYSSQDIKILLDLMSAFDLCHKFQNQSEWLIPSSLDGESKTNLVDFQQGNTRRYAIRYSVSLPVSVIHRFIVRNIRFAYNDDYWRNGIVLRHPNSETLMFVEADAKDKEIRLYIRGPLIVECWEFFRKDFRELSEKFEFEELIVLEAGNVVNYQLLVDARHAGKQSIFIGGKAGEINVHETLGMFETERDQHREMVENEINNSKQHFIFNLKDMEKDRIFISYAHHDNDFGQVDVFESELSRLLPRGKFEIFKDDQIILGEDWAQRLEREFQTAKIGILLLSPSFFASGFITDIELVAFLEKRKSRSCVLCPVYFSPFNISEIGPVNKLQFFKPVGRKYGREYAEFGEKLCYSNFIKFHPSNGRILPSVERDQYMLDFVDALLKALKVL